ncbi:hypothetical protein IWX90DRAFT_108677 [Phyllosticta citrichinensis]|uniref:Uncharacterized protein n=1 Tax=Phyllosticta citrichinensis TaxID=1130410 RepID=A0ABR1Y2N6_9PEZI
MDVAAGLLSNQQQLQSLLQPCKRLLNNRSQQFQQPPHLNFHQTHYLLEMSSTKGAMATTTALPPPLPLREEGSWRRRASVMSISSIASRRSSLRSVASIFSVSSSNPDSPTAMRGPGSPEIATFQETEALPQGRRKSYVPKHAAQSFVNSTTLVTPLPCKSAPNSPLKSCFPMAVKDDNGLWNVDSPPESENEGKEMKKKTYRKSYSSVYGYERLAPNDGGFAGGFVTP